MAQTLKVNGKEVTVEAEPGTPLLWVLREKLGLLGTKFGCGQGLCGACTVHINGAAVRSCLLPLVAVSGEVTTIEGLSSDNSHPAQRAWIEADAPQCGYCQSGQIMSCAALLKAKAKPTEADISAAMTNLCRCGTYGRIRKAVQIAVKLNSEGEV
ncbi:(2Fe-2S)-binding protein [Vitiosangium sp. GDMCC 1.1324]|uniref:(2Fe-2S)-binding protein n=1 Tax=Vitiosangium sp. (strain GDMCC 1.1324) TaxID=2138576 RepID=UPI000D3C956D|nr:(2Fe-2S)-binding protein [Vitiosangium sp. GDMCC 1.1324]PTL80372.1 (2Fe-2S)-binding protein [Vitiosangium sp. GDMCC 1.1324]